MRWIGGLSSLALWATRATTGKGGDGQKGTPTSKWRHPTAHLESAQNRRHCMDDAQSSQGSNLAEDEAPADGWCMETGEKRTIAEATGKESVPLTLEPHQLLLLVVCMLVSVMICWEIPEQSTSSPRRETLTKKNTDNIRHDIDDTTDTSHDSTENNTPSSRDDDMMYDTTPTGSMKAVSDDDELSETIAEKVGRELPDDEEPLDETADDTLEDDSDSDDEHSEVDADDSDEESDSLWDEALRNAGYEEPDDDEGDTYYSTIPISETPPRRVSSRYNHRTHAWEHYDDERPTYRSERRLRGDDEHYSSPHQEEIQWDDSDMDALEHHQEDESLDAGAAPSEDTSASKKDSNWATWLVDKENQRLFTLIALLTTMSSGIGVGLAAYYLFYLDDSRKKDKASVMMSWASIAICILTLIIVVTMGVGAFLAGFALSPAVPA